MHPFSAPLTFSFFTKVLAGSVFAFSLTGCACSDNRVPDVDKEREKERQEVADAGLVSAQKPVQKAVAVVHPVGKSQVKGKVTFTKVLGGIKIVADVEGLAPGEHGFHVHEFGDCGGEGASAAGGHFNPTNQPHGGPDSPQRHVGDFGNLVADEQGHAHYERVDTVIALEGEKSIVGRSIMVHADRDDLTTQPTGASGARIGCGIIEAVE
jgi:Cu-Zn family superoxide dismutase